MNDLYFDALKVDLFDIAIASRKQPYLESLLGYDYWKYYFENNFDIIIDSVTIPVHKKMFKALKNESRDYKNIVEPCCQSGILGCYLAKDNNNYSGFDIENIAIDKARKFAMGKIKYPEVFKLGDYRVYDTRHDAVVGRFVLNNFANYDFGINKPALKCISRITDNVVLIEPYGIEDNIKVYTVALSEFGYKTKIVKKGLYDKGRHANLALIHANR